MTCGVSTPSQSHASRSVEGVNMGLCGFGSNVRKSRVRTCPIRQTFAVEAAVQDVEVLRPLEQFGLTNGPAVPCLPTAFEDGIGRILCDRCRVAGRRGRMTHGQSVLIRLRCLARVDDMNRIAGHSDRGMRRTVSLVVGIGGNHRGRPHACPLAHVAVADKQAGLLGRPLSLAPIVHVEFVVGGVQEWEGILDGLIIETLLRGYEDGVADVLLDVGEVGHRSRGVHQQPGVCRDRVWTRCNALCCRRRWRG